MTPAGDELRSGSPALGACFGYGIRSALSLRYLRSGDGDPLEIVEVSDPVPATGSPILEWSPPARPYRATLHREGDGFALWIDGGGWFRVDPSGGRIEVPKTSDIVRREERLWGMPSLLCFLARGDLPIHAAAVEVDGRALIFGAPGRFGKTTLATAFARAGHRVLAEDLTCVSLADGSADVVPGPAMLRVRGDVAPSLGLPGPADGEDRVHVALAAPGSGAPVALAGVVILQPSGEEVRVEHVPAASALPDVFALSFRLPGEQERARAFAAIAGLLDVAPAWYLHRPLRIDTLDATIEEVIATCLGARDPTVA